MRLDCYVGILEELEMQHYLMPRKIENVVAARIEWWTDDQLGLNSATLEEQAALFLHSDH